MPKKGVMGLGFINADFSGREIKFTIQAMTRNFPLVQSTVLKKENGFWKYKVEIRDFVANVTFKDTTVTLPKVD